VGQEDICPGEELDRYCVATNLPNPHRGQGTKGADDEQNCFFNALKVATGLKLGYLGPLRLCEAVDILAAHRLYLKRVTGDESKMVGPLVAMSTSTFKGFAKG